jgi:hypothetical protein
MFSTAKEVHIYIDGAIQLLSSNRKQSIAPELIDMILNNAASEYISSKFPNGYNPKDIEQTLKRYTEFSSLKRTDSITPFIEDNDCKIIKPFNALKIQSVKCSYKKPFGNSDKTISNMFVGVLSIDDRLFTEPNTNITINYTTVDGTVKEDIISLSAYLSSVKSEKGMFYFYDSLVSLLSNVYGFNVSYASFDKNGRRSIKIHMPLGSSISSLNSSSTLIVCNIESSSKTHCNKSGSVTVPVGIVPEKTAAEILNDYYSSVNLHRNPICTITGDEIVIPFSSFLPSKVQVSYIKKPARFDISTGTIPDMEITKDFLDYAVKQIHLITHDPNYEKVLNESLRNQ